MDRRPHPLGFRAAHRQDRPITDRPQAGRHPGDLRPTDEERRNGRPVSRQSDRSATAQFPTGRLRLALDRRAGWIEALVILTTIAVAFVVLGFAAAYFRDYFRIIVIFTVAWLLAFLIAPLADRLQGRFSRVPRPVAVMAVLVPIILLRSLVLIRLFAAPAFSHAQLGGALAPPLAHPRPRLGDIPRGAGTP